MSKLNKHSSGKIQETNKESGKNKDSRKHKKSSGKHSEHSRLEKVTEYKHILKTKITLRLVWMMLVK